MARTVMWFLGNTLSEENNVTIETDNPRKTEINIKKITQLPTPVRFFHQNGYMLPPFGKSCVCIIILIYGVARITCGSK